MKLALIRVNFNYIFQHKDLEQVIKGIELIKRYQTLLNSDIETLVQTGEEIKENDERLAVLSESNVTD